MKRIQHKGTKAWKWTTCLDDSQQCVTDGKEWGKLQRSSGIRREEQVGNKQRASFAILRQWYHLKDYVRHSISRSELLINDILHP